PPLLRSRIPHLLRIRCPYLLPKASRTTRLCYPSLHDALPISVELAAIINKKHHAVINGKKFKNSRAISCRSFNRYFSVSTDYRRSEEHTSELQSRFELVCRRLLEKKKGELLK